MGSCILHPVSAVQAMGLLGEIERKLGAAVSYTKCSQVACLVHSVGKNISYDMCLHLAVHYNVVLTCMCTCMHAHANAEVPEIVEVLLGRA